MVEFNKNEKDFLKLLEDVERTLPGDCEMEIDHYYVEGNIDYDGWYLYRYYESRGEAIPDDDPEPLITDKEAKEKDIDVMRCLAKYGCYYVA